MGNEESTPVALGNRLKNDITIELVDCTTSKNYRKKLPKRDGHCAASSCGKLYIYGGVQQNNVNDDGECCESNEMIELHCGKQVNWTCTN